MSARRTLLVSVAFAALWPCAGYAAGDSARDVALEIKGIVDAIKAIRANPSLDQDDRLAREIAFHSRRQRFFLVYSILRDQWGVVVTPADVASAREPDLSAVEQARTDVQAGASASASASSSLISKGSGPSTFAVAMENGGFLKSTSATTTTFQGNLIGILDTMSLEGYVSGYEDDAALTRFLRRISFSFTLRNANPDAAADPSTSGASGPTEAIRQQIAQFDERLEQYSVRAIVGRNRRDPRDEDNHTALWQLMNKQGQTYLAALDEALTDLQTCDGDPQICHEYDQWITDSVKELKAVPLPFLEGALIRRLNILSDLVRQRVRNFGSSAESVGRFRLR